MTANPYDPLKRTDLTENEKRALRFMAECLHGDNFDLIEEYVMVEHWDVVQRLPEPDYDPMALSSENLKLKSCKSC